MIGDILRTVWSRGLGRFFSQQEFGRAENGFQADAKCVIKWPPGLESRRGEVDIQRQFIGADRASESTRQQSP